MFDFLDLLSGIGDLLWSWRLSLCLIPAICLAVWVSRHVDYAPLVWLIDVPIVLGGLYAGLRWESRA